MGDGILLVLKDQAQETFLQVALDYVETSSEEVTVLQILNSTLYHYGHNDLLAGGRSKSDFLLYIRKEVLDKGQTQADKVLQEAKNRQLRVNVVSVESDDAADAVMAEVVKGYSLIILPKEEKKRFPLFHKTTGERIRKKTSVPILEL
ncbi:MAG: hypothetical protein AB1798_19030 [Spirochaetota bacterium]